MASARTAFQFCLLFLCYSTAFARKYSFRFKFVFKSTDGLMPLYILKRSLWFESLPCRSRHLKCYVPDRNSTIARNILVTLALNMLNV